MDFLIHLRANDKDLHPNEWDTRFGGHLKAGQSIEGAIVSEVKEEIGIDVSHVHLLKGEITKSQNFPNNEFTYPFFLEFKHENDLTFNDGEVQRVEWMSAEDIIHSMLTYERAWSASLQGFQKIYTILIHQLS